MRQDGKIDYVEMPAARPRRGSSASTARPSAGASPTTAPTTPPSTRAWRAASGPTRPRTPSRWSSSTPPTWRPWRPRCAPPAARWSSRSSASPAGVGSTSPIRPATSWRSGARPEPGGLAGLRWRFHRAKPIWRASSPVLPVSQQMSSSSRPALTGILRGLVGRCPNCGKGRLLRGYLKPVERCDVCGHEIGAYRADDGPAYFTILIVGHMVIAPLLFFPWIWEASPLLTVPATLIPLAAVTLLVLPRAKGGFIGLLWSHGQRGDEHGPRSELGASGARLSGAVAACADHSSRTSGSVSRPRRSAASWAKSARVSSCDSAQTAAPRTSGEGSSSSAPAVRRQRRLARIADGVEHVADEAVAADPLDRALGGTGRGKPRRPAAARSASERRAAAPRGRASACLAAGLGELVPGTDRQAVVAAVDAVAQRRPELAAGSAPRARWSGRRCSARASSW